MPLDEYIPVLRSNNIKNSLIDLQDLVYVKKSKISKKQLLIKGDLLITASTGSIKVIGKNAYVENDMEASFGAFCKVVRPKKIDSSYLKHMFQSQQYFTYIQSVVNGANINNIKNEHLDNFKIPLPPLETQKNIAQILDDAAALRDKTAQLIKEYDALAQSIFLDMFGDPVINEKGWEKVSLKKILLDVKNGITRRPKSKEDEGGDVVLKLKHIRGNYIDYQCENRILLNTSEKNNFNVKIGDLLFIRVNGNPRYVGRCALHTSEDCKVFFNDHIMRVRYDLSKFNGKFLCLYLNYPYGQLEVAKQIKTSAGQYTINQAGLEKIKLILPPIHLQNQFAEKIALIEQQKELAKQELKESGDLFNCLLQKVFKGELV